MPDITVYKATYSGTPVYEFIAKGIACMRRRSDSWINATQILKVADFDKPQRTRILEREVQRGTHEKVQGGYGKYQGTWVPLDRAKQIAAQYKVDELLAPIFDFRPSTESPPLAPKHITAASTKPRPARAPARAPALVKQPSKISRPQPVPVIRQPSVDSYDDEAEEQDEMSDMEPLDDRSSGSRASSASEGGISDGEMDDHPSQNSASMTLKRKRSQMEHDGMGFMSSPQHRHLHAYSDDLLDYFMSKNMGIPAFLSNPPPDFNANDVIDTEGNTAIHWATSMGDLKVVELLVRAHADIRSVNKRGETPLMRAVMFTNNYDRRSFPRLVEVLRDTIFLLDHFDASVFHHIAATTSSRNKLLAARYYNEVLLQKLSEARTMDDISHFLDAKDTNGDTALTISARNMAKKCVRTLLGYNANPDIRNNEGQTADQLIIAAEQHRRNGESAGYYPASSSPVLTNEQIYHGHYGRHPSQSAAAAAAINYAHASYIPQPHTSEAAIAATKKVIPQMAEMLEGLATAMDKELQDKEADHLQAQDILNNSTRDLEACRSTSEETIAPYGDELTMNAKIEALKHEAEMLSNDLRRVLERKQYHELSALVRDDIFDLSEDEKGANGLLDSEAEAAEKLTVALELAKVQAQGIELQETIIRAYARSGAGGKMGDYRRLIALSCSLLPDDVEKLLPEILRDLEAVQAGGTGITDNIVDGLV